MAHLVLFSATFLACSDIGGLAGLGYFRLSVIYDTFGPTVGLLNMVGLLFCAFLQLKGRVAPSGPDAGSSHRGLLFDYYWGTELYPRLWNLDVKKFVNCRFSMTYSRRHTVAAGTQLAY